MIASPDKRDGSERRNTWMGDWGLNQIRSGLSSLNGNTEMARGLLLERFPQTRSCVNLASLDRANQQRLIRWMKELEHSRVRSLLLEGPNSLPEIATQMHWLPGLFALADRPRTQQDLLAHLAKYLDWYAGEQKGMPLLVQLRAFATVGIGLLAIGINYSIRMFSATQPSITVDYSGMLQLYVLAFGAILAIMIIRLPLWFWNREALLRHLALYLYIKDCEENAGAHEPGKGKADG